MRPADVTDPSPVIAIAAPSDDARAFAPGDRLGDHHEIVKLLGAGGMGEVYLAHDARLERDVAIKVMNPAGRTRLIAEARAMARITHPNVVAVHEVEAIGDQVFIAMEYVDGPTLRAWLPNKPPAEVVRAFAACANGLAAAHRAGLVHGDFKPDNVLVGADQRVRVADFGLAHTGGPDAPRGGTPAYMAPELVAGGVATAASDQYALCVALREALAGRLAWIAPIVARGTAPSPADRFPSLEAVAAALSRDPAARRTRLLVAGAALAAVGIAGGVGFTRGRSATPSPCEDDAGALAGAWDPDVAAAVHARFAATGAPYAEDSFTRVQQQLDAYRDAWAVMHKDACVATAVRGDQSPATLDLRMQCLDRRRAELSALTARLASDAKIDRSIDAVRALPAIADCADTAMLSAVLPPPPDRRGEVTALELRLADQRVRVLLGEHEDARAKADAIVADARALSYPPQLASALMSLGDLTAMSQPKVAEAAFREAITAASRGRDDALAARAWMGLYGVVVEIEQKLDEEPELQAGATAAVARAGDPASLRVRLMNRIANAAHHKGQLDVAEKASDEAYKLAGDDASYRANALATRALVQRDRGDLEEAVKTAREALAQNEKAFGPKHPAIVGSLATLANLDRLAGDLDDANQQLARGLAIDEAALGPDSLEVGRLLTSRGTVLEGNGQYDEAVAAYTRALAIKQRVLGPDHREVANVYVNLAQVGIDRDDYSAAREAATKALAIYTAKLGDHAATASAAFLLGNVEQLTKHYAAARGHYQHALAIYAAIEANPTSVADTYSQLAITEHADGHDDAALPAVKKALELRGSHPSGQQMNDLVLVGEIELARGDLVHAESHFEAARLVVTVAGGDDVAEVRPLLGLARVMLATKRASEALPLLERAQEIATSSKDSRLDAATRADIQASLARAKGDRR